MAIIKYTVKKKYLKINKNVYEVSCIYKSKFNIRMWSMILKNMHIENKEKFCNINIRMGMKLPFFVEFWNRIIYGNFEK